MIEVIVFSHRRQLQLHAYLESLIHFVRTSEIHVIYPKENHYVPVWANFQASSSNIQFQAELDGFDATLRAVLKSVKTRYVMFGCDDVTWTHPVAIQTICEAITPDVLGFSLKLSDHIRPKNHPPAPMARKWNWADRAGTKTEPHVHLWGYPFELIGTVYRTSDVVDLLDQLPNNSVANGKASELEGPNHFEQQGCALWRIGKDKHNMRERRHCMLRNENASCICQSVNVVQSRTSSHQGTKEEEPDILEQKYQKGWRLDWKAAIDTRHHEVWTGVNDYWKLKNVNDK